MPDRPVAPLESRKPRRDGRGGGRSLARTILLGTLAVAASIWWLAGEFELDTEELLGFLMTSLVFVGLIIGFAILTWGVSLGVRRVLRRPRDVDPDET